MLASRLPIRKSRLWVVLAVALAGGCASDDGAPVPDSGFGPLPAPRDAHATAFDGGRDAATDSRVTPTADAGTSFDGPTDTRDGGFD